MFSETPFQARFGGIWVWASIRSGIKAVGCFRSKNLTIFKEILGGNIKKFAVLNAKIDHTFNTTENRPPDPHTPKTGLERSF